MIIKWRTEWPNWLVIVGTFFWAAYSWNSAPDRYPVHWGLSGQVDRYGGKVEGLLMLPAMGLAIYLLLLFLPRLDPGRANYARFAGPYAVIRMSIILLLGVLYAITQLAARGYPVDMAMIMPILIGGLLLVIGNYLGKIRPNWFVGIRTPWTLSSKTAWTRTHRLGGWLFALIGLALITAGLIRASWALIGAFVILGVGVVAIVVYSYLVWRSDPDRIPPTGTGPA